MKLDLNIKKQSELIILGKRQNMFVFLTDKMMTTVTDYSKYCNLITICKR